MSSFELTTILPFLVSWVLNHGIKIVFIIFGAWLIVKIGKKSIDRLVRRAVTSGRNSPEAEQKRENTLIKIFSGGLRIIVWSITVVMILPEFGVNIGPILAGAGVLGLAIGFGTQNMVRDFLAGLFVILENQYRVGDYICLDDTCGTVEDITLRKVTMRDLDGTEHNVSHGIINRVSNFTKGHGTAHMNVGVAYKEDVDNVMSVINKVGKDMAEESPWKEDIISPIQVVGTGPNSFSDSSIDIKVMGDTNPGTQWGILREFRRRLKIAFDEKGIEIPFPHRVVIMRKEGD